MDSKAKNRIAEMISKISSQELIGAELQENKLIYSVIGFISSSDFVDNALLISNLAYLLSQRGLNTCVLDFKVFYPNLYQYLDVKPNKKSDGLIKVLKSDKVDIRGEILNTRYERLYLLSPSPYDLMEEYYDFEFENVERVITTLKNTFDIVLIDIPNNPPLEFCLGAVKYSHVGFFTASERIECAGNMIKFLDYASSVGISTSKYTSVIFMNLMGFDYDYKAIEEIGFNIAAKVPFVKSAITYALEGRIYVKDNPLINKFFRRELHELADSLAEQ